MGQVLPKRKTLSESTHSKDKVKAKDFLKRRLAEIVTGNFCGPRAERIRVDELAEDFLRDYRINGRKSLPDAEARWRIHVEPFFGNSGLSKSQAIWWPVTWTPGNGRMLRTPRLTVNWRA